MKLKPQFRNIEVRQLNEENRTIELSFSSEEPYQRYWGIEILDHSPTSVNMERLNNSAPLLFNHDRDVVIGVVEYAKIEDKRGVALVRFGNSEKAKEVLSDVVKKVLTEFGIKPVPASPVTEEAPTKKEEPKNFEALVSAHPEYKNSKLNAMKAVMLSNPNEYREALARGIKNI